MYFITFTKTAKKQLSKLDLPIQKRVVNSLERIRVRPSPHVKKLVGNPYYCLRVGDYRVILNIKSDILLILVIEVGHRSKIYK